VNFSKRTHFCCYNIISRILFSRKAFKSLPPRLQMSDFKAKVHQIRFWLGLHLRLHWGAYSVYSPTALAGGEEFAAPFSITHLLLSALRGPNFVHVGLEKVFLIRSSPLPTIYGSATDCGHQQGRGGSTLGPGGTGPLNVGKPPHPQIFWFQQQNTHC